MRKPEHLRPKVDFNRPPKRTWGHPPTKVAKPPPSLPMLNWDREKPHPQCEGFLRKKVACQQRAHFYSWVDQGGVHFWCKHHVPLPYGCLPKLPEPYWSRTDLVWLRIGLEKDSFELIEKIAKKYKCTMAVLGRWALGKLVEEQRTKGRINGAGKLAWKNHSPPETERDEVDE